MKAVTLPFAGKEYCMAFTGAAMFEIRDRFGGVSELMDAVKADTKESFHVLCEAVALLAEQGELARRQLGYEPREILNSEVFQQSVTPAEIVVLKTALLAAIELGYGREVNPKTKEFDLGLAELNQKKTH